MYYENYIVYQKNKTNKQIQIHHLQMYSMKQPSFSLCLLSVAQLLRTGNLHEGYVIFTYS